MCIVFFSLTTIAFFIEAIKALPFFLLASEFDLFLKPCLFGLDSSSFFLSVEFDLELEPLLLSGCFALLESDLAPYLLFSLDLCFSWCFESVLEPQVPDLGLGISILTSSVEVVGKG